jgi:hypothetical protein
MLSGKLKDDQLVQIRESEEELGDDKLEELQRDMEHETERLAAAGKKRGTA